MRVGRGLESGILSAVVPDIEPMLATTGIPDDDLTGWSVEPKLDGWRARVLVDGRRVRVVSRNGNDLTERLAELRNLVQHGVAVVLDGELVVGAGRLADFYGLSGRLAGLPRPSSPTVTFAAFDILWCDGGMLTNCPYSERRAVLEALELAEASTTVVPRHPGEDAGALYRACDEQGLEGVVLKRLASTYRPGKRTRDWRKVKCGAGAEHAERRRPPD
jgi:bifunctional non-homologous end joining protein LigD